MKLLILTAYYPPEINAASVRISHIVKRFLQRGNNPSDIRVIVFNPLYNKDKDKLSKSDGIEIKRYGIDVLPKFMFLPQSLNPITLLIWIYIAMKEVARYDPDVILATTPPFGPVVASSISSKILKKPHIIDYRDNLTSVIDEMAAKKSFYIKYPLKAINNFISSLLHHSIKAASLVCTVNEVLREKLLNLNKDVIVVPNGIDIQELKEVKNGFDKDTILSKNGISHSKNSKILVYVGDLNMPYYMPEIILAPLKSIRDKGYDIKYLIIGDGKKRHLIEEMKNKMGLNDAVFLLGKKSHREVVELLLASDAAFYSLQKDDPQSKHAIGVKVYEYIACGVPIFAITDKDSAVSNLIRKYDIGKFLSWEEIENADSIEEALQSLLDSDKYSQNLYSKHQYFIKKFDRNNGIDILYDRIKKLLDSEI